MAEVSGTATGVGAQATLSLKDAGEDVTLSLSGTYDMTVQLERERGSPGSGSWEVVLGPYTTANATVSDIYTTKGFNENLRLNVTVDNSGTLTYSYSDGDKTIDRLVDGAGNVLNTRTQAGLTEHNDLTVGGELDAPRRISHQTNFVVFDDFLDAAIDTTNNWIVFAGTDADATAAATVTAPEGKVDMGSGDGGSTEDGSVLSLILLAKGSLVSLGGTVFECRVSFDQLTGVTACFGLSDKLATTAEHLLHTVDSGTVADGGLSVSDTAEFVFSTDATDSTNYQIVSENGGTIGNSAAEEVASAGPTADTYDILRIEVDANGDARYYLNGTLEATRESAVATTALLIPYIAIDAGTDAQTVTDLSIDYIRFEGNRPSSNA